MTITQLDVPLCTLGESPFWCDINQYLCYVDILNKKLYFYYPQSGALNTHDLPALTSAAIPTTSEKHLILISDQGILLYNTALKSVVDVITHYPGTVDITRPNEAAATPSGDIIFGTMPYLKADDNTIGAWYHLDHDSRQLKIIGAPVNIPNTLCWHKNWLYFADSKKQQIYQSSLDMENVTLFHQDTGNDSPDGSCISQDGFLWNAKWGGAKIAGYKLPTAQETKELQVPAINPTSCCFGGKFLDTLFITSSLLDIDQPNAAQGALFAVKNVGIGQKVNRYKLSYIKS